MFKWRTCYTEMTDFLQFTVNVRKFHHQHQCTLQLVCEDGVFFVRVELHVSLCGLQHPQCERASNSSRVPTLRLWISLFIHPHKQKSEGVISGYSYSPILVIIKYQFLFPQRRILSNPKIMTFPPESHCTLTYLLTPWSRVLLEKLTGFAANQEIPRILWNPESSLPYS